MPAFGRGEGAETAVTSGSMAVTSGSKAVTSGSKAAGVARVSSSDVAPLLSAPTVMTAMTAIDPPTMTTATMNENTVNDSVVGPDGTVQAQETPSNPATPKPFRWVVWFGLAGFVAAVVAGFSIPLPYYTIAPGQALDVRPLVKVGSGPNDDSEGQFFLTTVSLGQANLFQALAGWVDSSVDVIEESAIRPPSVSPEELTKLNLEQMANSKQTALGVAFEYLGYDAISGDGAKIVGIEKGSPADSSLRVDEVITAVNGAEVNDHLQLVKIVRATRPGARVVLDLQSGGGERRVDIELGSNPTNVEQGFLGVQLSTHNLRFDFPYELELESERIGGPSAGLAYTLEVLDILTEGDLAGGRKVAVTGTIELDGTVGEVGGVAQKAVAVREAKADVFIVPSAEREEVKRAIGRNIEVVGVDSLTDAIAQLERMGGRLRPIPVDQVARSVRSGT